MPALEKIAIVVPAYNEPGIGSTLQGLYEQHQSGVDTHHFIVDNGSVDDTRARIEAFMDYHDDFPLTILEESQKGTGAAADTGFRTAIDQGYSIIARTDADTVPRASWVSTINDGFNSSRKLQLLGGNTAPLRDEKYRYGDTVLLPVGIKAARIILSIKNGDPRYLRAVNGANMATRAEAYQAVGGMGRSSIDTIDEDIDYSLKIAKKYGIGSIKIDPDMKVETSMRRIRQYGIAGIALHHLFPELRKNRTDGVDVR